MIAFAAATSSHAARNFFSVRSPNGINTVELSLSPRLEWSVTHAGRTVLEPSALGLRLANGTLIVPNAVVDHERRLASFGPLELDPTSPRDGYILNTPKAGWSELNVPRHDRR